MTGADLKNWREAAGMTQRAAARAVGVHYVSWCRAERKAATPLGSRLRAALTSWANRTREGGGNGYTPR